MAPLLPTGMQKVQRLENLKKIRGRGANRRFQALASLTWGWFKLEVKVRARCSFSMSQSIRSGRKLRIKRRLSGAETFTRASPWGRVLCLARAARGWELILAPCKASEQGQG